MRYPLFKLWPFVALIFLCAYSAYRSSTYYLTYPRRKVHLPLRSFSDLFSEKKIHQSIQRLFCASILLLCFSIAADAQSATDAALRFNKIIPVEPNAASLIKYSEAPVSYFNGSVQTSIPIHTIDLGGMSLPITLSNHGSALKVTEEASWVGLGWSLDCGGVVVHNIAGRSDLVYPTSTDSRAYPEKHSLSPHPNSNTYVNSFERGMFYKDKLGNSKYFPRDFFLDGFYKDAEHDGEYDLFSYNFSGHTGKFILEDSQPRTINQSNLKISFLSPEGYQIITSDGFKFLFKDRQTVISGTIYSPSFYLTEIINPHGRTVATFIYTKTVSEKTLPILNQVFVQDALGIENTGNTNVSRASVENLYLDEIILLNGKIKFNTSFRDDLDNGKRLSSVQFFRNGESQPFKTASFNYDYFVGSHLYGDFLNDPFIPEANGFSTSDYPLDYRAKRLKVTSVSINDAHYSFEYNQEPLPYKTSLAQDLWGYFNGVQDNHSLIPDFNNLPYFDHDVTIDFRNGFAGPGHIGYRAPNEDYIEAGTLIKVKYPTGGFTEFDYESHILDINSIASVSTAIQDTTVWVSDIGSGISQAEFEVTAIGHPTDFTTNPAKISVSLFSSGPYACSQPNPSGYHNDPYSPPYNPHYYGIYALIEKFNTQTSSWNTIKVYDKNSPEFQNGTVCNLSSLPLDLSAGRYRITANYPDYNPPGQMGHQWASITITYKVLKNIISSPQTVNYTGGGIRIKGVTNYLSDGVIGTQKSFAYEGPVMMNKPHFCRTFNGAYFSMDPMVGSGSFSWNGDYLGMNSSRTLYSNPLIPYSYSANGSLVGYKTVTETYLHGSNDNGKTVYTYNLNGDNYFFYKFNPPGIPSIPDLDNGSLKEVLHYKAGSITPIKSIAYQYDHSNFKVVWSYKVEYIPFYSRFQGVVQNIGFTPGSQFLHFYPIMISKSLLKKKIETDVDEVGNQISKVEDYSYNQHNQQKEIVSIDSKGASLSTTFVYPTDFTVQSGFLKDMKDQNIIDAPIEIIRKRGNEVTGAMYTTYSTADGIISPNEIFGITPTNPVTMSSAAPNNIPDVRYKTEASLQHDNYGNLVSKWDKGVTGKATSYIWGYNQTLPVVKGDNISLEQLRIRCIQALNAVGYTNGLVDLDAFLTSLGNLTSTSSINSWRVFNETLRNNTAADVAIASYSYDPLIGMSSAVNVRGQKTSYEYDSTQRLKLIRDHNGSILKKIDYQYRP